MADVLSQSEIDNLLTGLGTSPEAPGKSMKGVIEAREILNYDFRRPNRISKNQVRQLQTVHESFAEIFGYYLMSKLQTSAQVTVTSVDQLFYSEFILSVSNPSCLYIFDIEGTDGSGVWELSPQLALAVVERLLGGNSDVQRKPRSITPIEQAVLKNVVEHGLAELTAAWKAITEVNFKLSRFETEADFVQVAPSSEIVVAVSFDVHVGLHSHMMNLCFPTFALEDIIARLSRQMVSNGQLNSDKNKENASMMKQQLSVTTMPVKAELGKAAISVEELLKLRTGDVLKLGTKVDQEIEIFIGGMRKLAARPGVVDGKKAVRITRELTDNDLVEADLSFKET